MPKTDKILTEIVEKRRRPTRPAKIIKNRMSKTQTIQTLIRFMLSFFKKRKPEPEHVPFEINNIIAELPWHESRT